MAFHFVVRGRLGNAIFRYLACAVLCINTDNKYINSQGRNPNMTEEIFNEIAKHLMENKKIEITQSYNMGMFYQHDLIYKKFKKEIIDFINQNPEHSVKTDGITPGDMNSQEFKMIDIINTKPEFSKRYKNVLHVRLEDFVTYSIYLNVERIIDLLEKDVIKDELCIVCKQPTTDFEFNYLNTIKETLVKKNIKCIFEHNDILTDYYICKEAELLICSKSTLSWCAAFFSDKIKICFFPNYKESVNQTCKYPIDNTEFY